MKVLLNCEESQVVCKAFRERGHGAYSCDLQECSGGHPEWHIQDDAIRVAYSGEWDLMIAFPPCTYLSSAAGRVLYDSIRLIKTKQAFDFVMKLWNAPIKKIGLENPVGWLNTNWRPATQIIHPWYFGDNDMKRTCLWLKGLPRLNGLIHVAMEPEKYKPIPTASRIGSDGKVKNAYFMTRVKNQKLRSKTFPSIAKKMAEQWV